MQSTPVPSPLPTFFDITPIPYIPWEPDFVTWCLLLVGLLVLLALGSLCVYRRQPTFRSAKNLESLVIESIHQHLQNFEHTGDIKFLTRLSLDVRHFLELTEIPRARSLTAGELRAHAKSSPSMDFRNFVNTLADIDLLEYAPLPNKEDGLDLGRAMLHRLKRYLENKGAT